MDKNKSEAKVVDVHAHFTPPEWIDAVRRNGAPYGSHIEEDKSCRAVCSVVLSEGGKEL